MPATVTLKKQLDGLMGLWKKTGEDIYGKQLWNKLARQLELQSTMKCIWFWNKTKIYCSISTFIIQINFCLYSITWTSISFLADNELLQKHWIQTIMYMYLLWDSEEKLLDKVFCFWWGVFELVTKLVVNGRYKSLAFILIFSRERKDATHTSDGTTLVLVKSLRKQV